MFSRCGIKVLAGAVAVAIAGSAMANTTLNGTTTGDLFLNIEDTTNNTSYLFDTGISQAAFNSGTSTSACDAGGACSFNLSSDANLTGFLNSKDSFDYSVVSGVNSPAVSIDITGNTAPGSSPTAFNDLQARSSINTFLTNANLVANASTTSAVLPTGSDWGQALNEGATAFRLFGTQFTPYGDQSALDTALAFYQFSAGNSSTFAGSWDFSSATDTLTYSVSAVPLPTPILLLLSGIGLMGAVSRRTKAAA
jgi:hypothetical protein